MSRDANGPFQLSGSIATASLKQRLLAQRAANQDAPGVSTRKPAIVDLSKKLVARKTLSEKQFLRQRDRFRFAVLEGVLSDLIGLDVEVLWPQDFFKRRARKRLVDYIEVVRDGLIPPVVRVNSMLQPVKSLHLTHANGSAGTLRVVSLLGEHSLSEHIESDDLPSALRVKVKLEGGEKVSPCEFGLVITGAQGQEELLNECDGVAPSRSLHDDRLGAQDWEADDLWLEEQNAAMADVQFWWVEGDEADLVALGRGIGEVIYVGQTRVSTGADITIDRP